MKLTRVERWLIRRGWLEEALWISVILLLAAAAWGAWLVGH